jgi:glutamate racemase
MNNNPIGVFDSGSGGLSIFRSIQTELPDESCIYFGDHLYTPYGDKDTDFIRARVVKAIKYLLSRQVKLVVIACNTATIAGIEYYRASFPDMPIVGVVPVIKTASTLSKTKHFVVLSTHYTAKSGYQRQLIHQFASECSVTSLGSSRLVPLIESGDLTGSDIEKELRHMLRGFHNSLNDVVVLGCTHYPFLTPMIRAIIGGDIPILDSGAAVARQVKKILDHRNELGLSHRQPDMYVTTGDEIQVATLFCTLLSAKIHVTHVNI